MASDRTKDTIATQQFNASALGTVGTRSQSTRPGYETGYGMKAIAVEVTQYHESDADVASLRSENYVSQDMKTSV